MTSLAGVSSADSFWERIEAVKTEYKPDEPVVVSGKMIADRASKLYAEMVSSCTSSEEFMGVFFGKPPKRVLDLGCGMGANSIKLIKAGSYVCGIDREGDLLTKYLRNVKNEGCPTDNFRLRCCDLTKLETYREYEKPFNLVAAVDILPYIAPKNLRATMAKIRECLSEGGHFVGTIFTVESMNSALLELMPKLGAHCYEGGESFVLELLSKSGFEVKRCIQRDEGGFSFIASRRE